jgi:superfamily II DNA or RNA helicase
LEGSQEVQIPEITLRIQNTRVELLWMGYMPDPVLDGLGDALSYLKEDASMANPMELHDGVDEAEHIWDGRVRFLRRPKTKPTWFATGLLWRACWYLGQIGVPYRVEDAREAPEEDVPRYLTPIELWDHQLAAADACTRVPVSQLFPATANPAWLPGRGVIDLPPRAGKTRTLLEVWRRLDQYTLWVAPTAGIVEQTRDAALKLGFPEIDVRVAKGPNWFAMCAGARLVICTAAKALTLPPMFMQTRRAVILDEFHHFTRSGAWGRELVKNGGHIYYWFGCTGTHFRSGSDEMGMEAMIGQKLYSMRTTELLELGKLVPTKVIFVPVDGPQVRGAAREFHGYDEDGTPAGFGTMGIHTHDFRNRLAAGAAKFLYDSGRTCILIVGTKAQGYKLAELLAANLPPAPMGAAFKAVEFISTDRKQDLRSEILKNFVNGGEVKVLIGTSCIGEGIDMPPADALVWARGEKAPVTLVQGWFRVCTADGHKTNSIVVDFADRHHKKLMEHSAERLKLAMAEPIFDVQILPSPDDFARWVATIPPPRVRTSDDRTEPTRGTGTTHEGAGSDGHAGPGTSETVAPAERAAVPGLQIRRPGRRTGVPGGASDAAADGERLRGTTAPTGE